MRHRLPLLLAVGLVVGALVAPTQAARPDNPGNPDKPGFFTCSASALRVTFSGALAPLGTVEPFAANPAPNQHCADAQSALLSDTTVGPVTIAVLEAGTDAQRRGSEAAAQVLHVAVGPAEVTLLSSFASAQCQNNPQERPTARRPILGGGAEIASVKLDGQELVPAEVNQPRVIEQAGVRVALVEESSSTTQGRDRGGEVSSRALHVETPVASVVVAEAVADYHGQPCAPGQTKEE